MPYVGEGRAALQAAIPKYYNVAGVFFKSLIKGVNDCDPFQVVVDFAGNKLLPDDWKNDFKSKHTYSGLEELEELKEAAMKCWKKDTTLFYVCVESVTKCTITKENDQRLYSLKMVIDTMCVLLDDKDIQEDIGTTLKDLLFEKQKMVNATKQQHELTIEDCLDDEKLFNLLKGVPLSLENRFQRYGRPNNDVPDFPSVQCYDVHGRAYYLFGTNKYVGEESDGLTSERIGNSLVVKDNMGCKVIQEIGSDWCCVHYNSFVVKHRLYKYYVSAGRFKDAPVHRIYIKLPFLEFISPECFFVMQKFPDLYAIAKNVYGVQMES
jgi:hypothetical protein